jgi:hypothetical protein
MKTAVDLAHREKAYGDRFVFPGASPLPGKRLAEIAK